MVKPAGMLQPTRSSEGYRLLNLGQLPEAANEFRNALSSDPKDVKCLVGLARAQAALGQVDDALGTLGQVLALRADHLEAKSLRGLLRATHKGEAEGVKELEDAAKDRRSGASEHFNLGLYLAGRDDVRAQREFELALRSEVRDARIYVELGRVAERKGDLHSALTHFTKATQFASPNDPLPFLMVARVQQGLGAGPHAAQAAVEATQRATGAGRAEIYPEAFRLCLDVREGESAVKVALAALEHDASSPEYQGWLKQAQELIQGGGGKKAAGSKELWTEDAKSAAPAPSTPAAAGGKAAPANIEDLQKKAQEVLLLKAPPNPEEAIKLIDVVLQAKPEDPRCNILKGIALGLLKRYDEALPFAKKALVSKNPDHLAEATALVSRLETLSKEHR